MPNNMEQKEISFAQKKDKIEIHKNRAIIFTVIVATTYAVVMSYLKYVWKPNVVVKSVDYEQGFAIIQINNNKPQVIYSGSTICAGNGWGVKFSPHVNRRSLYWAARIELVKDHLVHSYLDVIKDEKTNLVNKSLSSAK